MNRRIMSAIAIVLAASVALLLWQLRSGSDTTSTTTPGEPGATQKNPQTRPPALPGGRLDPNTPGSATADDRFERVRREALARFSGELTTNAQMCATSGGSRRPSQPRDVRLVFEWQPALSTPQMQTLVVRELSIVDVGGLSTESRDCIRRVTGMQLTLPIPADQLPRDAHTFEQIVQVPVP